jgi:hypothetical protein
MSFDLYLLGLPTKSDITAALRLFNGLEKGTVQTTHTFDRHRLAKLLVKLDSRYEMVEPDYEEIAKYEESTPEQARQRNESIEVVGDADGKPLGQGNNPLAQFIIYDNRIVVHWYPGTTEKDMNRYLQALGEKTGYSLIDPQDASVMTLPGKKRSAR